MASPPNETNKQESQTHNTSLNHYNETIPTLPQSKIPWTYANLLQYKGFWLTSPVIKGLIFNEYHHFKAMPNDIILSSCVKCGTTWLKALLFATTHRSSYDFSTHPLLSSNPHDLVPFLEKYMIHDPSVVDNNLPSPRLLHTHLPFTLIPEPIISSDFRLVFICREPKDVMVSLWHFLQKAKPKELPPLAFEDAFEMFCDGVSPYGPYWDNVLSYWKASLEMPEKILFLKYEDMKRETVFHVKRLAEFIGKSFSMEEENNGVIDEIITFCSFEKLSNLDVNKNGEYRHLASSFKNSSFFRKGEIGDWKNYLTPEMAARVDQITKEKLHTHGLAFE